MKCQQKVAVVIILAFAFFPIFSGQGVAIVQAESDPLIEQLQQWEEQGIDPNHMDVIDAIRSYLDAHIDDDVFAGLHIDREEKELGIVVLSFTEDIGEEHKQALKAMETEHTEIRIREVDYSEQELKSKQAEIDFDAFEHEGITIYHTGIDVISNRVEIGISPYSEENAEKVYERYGRDMIQVVEGEAATTEAGVNTAGKADVEQDDAESIGNEVEDDKNAFQKFFSTIIQWFSKLFS